MGLFNSGEKSIFLPSGYEIKDTRYGFGLLAQHKAAAIWQPDTHWCAGLSELYWIDALARSEKIPVIPHGRWSGGSAHFVLANENTSWCEMFVPPTGGPTVNQQFEEEQQTTVTYNFVFFHTA